MCYHLPDITSARELLNRVAILQDGLAIRPTIRMIFFHAAVIALGSSIVRPARTMARSPIHTFSSIWSPASLDARSDTAAGRAPVGFHESFA